MDTRRLTRKQLAAWVRLAAVLELLPAALDGQLRRDAELTHSRCPTGGERAADA